MIFRTNEEIKQSNIEFLDKFNKKLGINDKVYYNVYNAEENYLTAGKIIEIRTYGFDDKVKICSILSDYKNRIDVEFCNKLERVK